MSVTDIASRCLRDSLGSLTDEERGELRSLFLKEARKGAFVAPGPDVVANRTAFCEHVLREFGPTTLLVIDALPYFRRKALEQIGDDTPLASLLLYAAWIENWVNVLIVIGMGRRGQSSEVVDAYFARRQPFKERLDHLCGLCNASLPEKATEWLMNVMKTRGRYHHYVWKGDRPTRIRKDLKRVAALVRRGDEMVDSLLTFEHHEFDAALLPLGLELFPAAR